MMDVQHASVGPSDMLQGRPTSPDTPPKDEQSPQENRSSPPESSPGAIPKASSGSSRQPLSRRGHFKSRLGCFNCKRRRVKCNEQRPFCSPCRRLGLTCVYPTAPNSAPPPIRSNPSTLAFEDLRFYHQFLTIAYPTLPLLAEPTWIQSASMSHNYEYLSHAILGLGASHLSQNGNVDYTAQALHHRVAAIKLVNEQLDHPPKKTADADALLATVLCLVTQSSLMQDSMIEYLTMIRGCNLVATSIVPDYDSSIFRGFTAQGHVEAIAQIVTEEPKDLELIDGFHASASSIAALCQLPCELVYSEFMLKCAQSMRTSSFEGWKDFVTLFMLPTTFSNEEFLSFIQPDNHVGHLLVIHMFLLDYVLGQICIAPAKTPKACGRKTVIIAWARNLANTLPAAYQKFAEWPRRFCDQLEHRDGRYLFSP